MNPRVRAWLGLGSNQSSPVERVRRALRELGRLPGTRLLGSSRLLVSSPVGRSGQPDFINCCALVETRLSPMGLLTELKRLEAEAGREPGRRWGPRPLDIDVLFYGEVRMRTLWIELPHPRALRRRFVLEGLAELALGFPPPVPPRALVEAWHRASKDPAQNVRVYRRSSSEKPHA